MSFLERLEELLQQKNMTTNRMCTELKIGKNSMVNWRERGNLPNGETLQKMADYFDVSVDYLLGRSDERNLITKHAASTVDDTQYDDLPEEAIQEMETFRQFLKEKYKKK